MKITLTGFMGSGKTTVGRLLQSALPGFEVIDLDLYIESRTAKKVSEIFSAEGEEGFRKTEFECLKELLEKQGDIIIALGGGAVTWPDSYNLVKSSSLCVYIKASADTLRNHIVGRSTLQEAAKKRPMLLNNGIEELLEKRSPVYESVASYIVESDGRSARQVAEEILATVLFSR